MEKRNIHFSVPFISNYQAAEVAQPGKSALDFPAPAIAAKLAAVLSGRANAVGAVRANKLDVAFAHSWRKMKFGGCGMVARSGGAIKLGTSGDWVSTVNENGNAW